MCAVAKEFPVSGILLDIHRMVYAVGEPNFRGAKIVVPTRLNIPFWRSQLQNYHDSEVVNFLEYGWPINVAVSEDRFQFASYPRNHTGAKEFPAAVETYLAKEIEHGAVLGPFKSNPFTHDIVMSPLNTVPKSAGSRRVILDLSWPKGNSVNSFIDKDSYLGEECVLSLPKLDKLVQIVLSKGKGCLLLKGI